MSSAEHRRRRQEATEAVMQAHAGSMGSPEGVSGPEQGAAGGEREATRFALGLLASRLVGYDYSRMTADQRQRMASEAISDAMDEYDASRAALRSAPPGSQP